MSKKTTASCSTAGNEKEISTADRKGIKRERSIFAKATQQCELEGSQAKWTQQEKHKLLDGIRRYGADNYSVIANFVQTRTAEDVESYIEQLRRNEPRPKKKRRDQCGLVYEAEAEPDLQDMYSFMQTDVELLEGKRSPIEAWTELITEMTFHELHDYSEEVSKVFGLIARNEEFEPSEVPRLRWQKIYQFIADLLEDKSDIQELSDIESHIVIDMMQKLGDSLHTSDTTTQHRLLMRKYALLNVSTDDGTDDGRRLRNKCLYKAFTNDFDYKTNSPFNPLQDIIREEAGTTVKASASTQSLHNRIKASHSSTQLNNTCNEVYETSMDNHDASTSQSQPTSIDNNDASTSQTDPTSADNDTSTSQTDPTTTENTEVSETQPGKTFSRTHGVKEFNKPPLYTLNPLCIPTELLSLKPRVSFC